MFFIMGINTGRKDLSFNQTMICSICGRYGSYSVYMTYTVLSLFFIPVFKWGRKYYVKTSCCHRTYQLDPEIGRRIARGESVEIRPEDLIGMGSSGSYLTNNTAGNISVRKTCAACGFTTEEDYDYCPKCGHPLQ